MTTASRFGESVPVHTLADGYQIPTLALGVCQTPEGTQTKDAVRWALELGYRHVDTAQAYGNEQSVGEGFRQSGLVRDDVFITTKFHPGSRDPVREIEASLQRLKLEYVDLYLVHWPFPNHHSPGCDVNVRNPHAVHYIHDNYMRTWRKMEELVDRGLVRHIGTSNMTIPKMKMLLRDARIKPAHDELHYMLSAWP